MRYAIVIEKTETGFGAQVPDLPGCVAVADTEQQAGQLIHEAVEQHLESFRASGQPIPSPSQTVGCMEVLRPA